MSRLTKRTFLRLDPSKNCSANCKKVEYPGDGHCCHSLSRYKRKVSKKVLAKSIKMKTNIIQATQPIQQQQRQEKMLKNRKRGCTLSVTSDIRSWPQKTWMTVWVYVCVVALSRVVCPCVRTCVPS